MAFLPSTPPGDKLLWRSFGVCRDSLPPASSGGSAGFHRFPQLCWQHPHRWQRKHTCRSCHCPLQANHTGAGGPPPFSKAAGAEAHHPWFLVLATRLVTTYMLPLKAIFLRLTERRKCMGTAHATGVRLSETPRESPRHSSNHWSPRSHLFLYRFELLLCLFAA